MSLLIINDANILIDFCKLDMIDILFKLNYYFCTVDVVWNELLKNQQDKYLPYINDYRFFIETIEDNEMEEVYTVRYSQPQLSLSDCSVLIYAKTHGGVLLSYDKNLSNTAIKNKVIVKGHLGVFDELVRLEIIDRKTAAMKFDTLCDGVNPLYLPENE